MAIYGALGEGPQGTNQNRAGEYVCRGLATVTGTLTITVPLPMRTVTHVLATIKMASALNSGLDPSLVTVGTYSGNTFILYVWKPTSNSNPTLIASTHAVPVEWLAFCTL